MDDYFPHIFVSVNAWASWWIVVLSDSSAPGAGCIPDFVPMRVGAFWKIQIAF